MPRPILQVTLLLLEIPTACRPSGSRTRQPGWRGRTISDDWPGKFEPIPWVYAEIIRNLARHERVNYRERRICGERRARKILERANALNDNVRFHRWPTNRVWTRDSGCTSCECADAGLYPYSQKQQARTLATGRPRRDQWRFNAWAKYPNWQHDEKIGGPHGVSQPASGIRPRHPRTAGRP